jgi:hypothetical protein
MTTDDDTTFTVTVIPDNPVVVLVQEHAAGRLHDASCPVLRGQTPWRVA